MTPLQPGAPRAGVRPLGSRRHVDARWESGAVEDAPDTAPPRDPVFDPLHPLGEVVHASSELRQRALSANLGFGKLIDTDDERVEPLLGALLGLRQGAKLSLRRALPGARAPLRDDRPGMHARSHPLETLQAKEHASWFEANRDHGQIGSRARL